MLEQIDFIASIEHRTRSDLIRESLRRYIESFRRAQVPRTATEIQGMPFDLARKNSLEANAEALEKLAAY
jgi:metal-responsive CopG/Arc/MetJ family transcriptional regulator